MLQAMDWIAKEAAKKRSEYYGVVDVEQIAVAGQSCGGAQALVASSDPRVKTTVMVNSGMGDIEMSGGQPRVAPWAPRTYSIYAGRRGRRGLR